MKKIIIAVITVLVLIGAGWYAYTLKNKGSNSNTAGSVKTTDVASNGAKIIARVNGEDISKSQLEVLEKQIALAQKLDFSTLKDDDKQKIEKIALDTVIGQILIKQAAESDSAFKASKEDIDSQITTIKSRFDTEEAFKAELDKGGLTQDSFRKKVATDLTTQRYLTSKLKSSDLKVTDEEVKATYDKSVAGVKNAPDFEKAKDQVKSFVLQQKQQQLLNNLIKELRAKANVEIL